VGIEQSADGSTDETIGFLLVQLGFHAARLFKERLAPLGIEPRHVGLLRSVAAHEGRSQQVIGESLRIPKSRMVWLIDDLEQRGLVERRRSSADRRINGLYLTPSGRRLLEDVLAVSAEHEAQLSAALQSEEYRRLATLLRRLADAQGIAPNALPAGAPPASPRLRG